MVRRDVEENAALRGEGVGVFELKAGRLADDGDLVADLAHEGGQRGPDVARHCDGLIGRAPDMAEQLGDRGLAVRAGHRDKAIWQQAPGQLQLTDHGKTASPGFGDGGRGAWHPGALD
jgi:hypothetical protein